MRVLSLSEAPDRRKFSFFFPKDIFFGSVWALSVGVCEMWTTWLCGPVAVPAHPRILAGRQSRRISGEQISGQQGSCGISGDPILSTQRIPRSADPILSTQRIPRGWDMILSTQKNSWRHILKNQWYIQNFSALRALIVTSCEESFFSWYFFRNYVWKQNEMYGY